MSEYFLKPNSLGENVKPEINWPNYATSTDLKTATGVNTSSYAKKVDLANLKPDVEKVDIAKLKKITKYGLKSLESEAGKLDVDKLIPVPVDLSKLIHVAKNGALKTDVYNAKIKNTEDKIVYITNLATNDSFNAKLNEV